MELLFTRACKKLNRIFRGDEKILHNAGNTALQPFKTSSLARDCTSPAGVYGCYFIASEVDIYFRLMMSKLGGKKAFEEGYNNEKFYSAKPRET